MEGTPTSLHAGRTVGGEEQALWTPMPAQPLTSCEALGKSLELLEPQLLHLLNGNNRLYVTKVYPGHIMALTECLAYSIWQVVVVITNIINIV